MEQLLMSALMAATSRRDQLREYANLEYSAADAPRIAAGIFEEPGGATTNGKQTRDPSPAAPPKSARGKVEKPSDGEWARPASSDPDPVAAPSYGPQVLTRPPGGPWPR
jgi:hypothetical protein